MTLTTLNRIEKNGRPGPASKHYSKSWKDPACKLRERLVQCLFRSKSSELQEYSTSEPMQLIQLWPRCPFCARGVILDPAANKQGPKWGWKVWLEIEESFSLRGNELKNCVPSIGLLACRCHVLMGIFLCAVKCIHLHLQHRCDNEGGINAF